MDLIKKMVHLLKGKWTFYGSIVFVVGLVCYVYLFGDREDPRKGTQPVKPVEQGLSEEQRKEYEEEGITPGWTDGAEMTDTTVIFHTFAHSMLEKDYLNVFSLFDYEVTASYLKSNDYEKLVNEWGKELSRDGLLEEITIVQNNPFLSQFVMRLIYSDEFSCDIQFQINDLNQISTTPRMFLNQLKTAIEKREMDA